jgi:hypothetical protein
MNDGAMPTIDMIKQLYLLKYDVVLEIFGENEHPYVIRLW